MSQLNIHGSVDDIPLNTGKLPNSPLPHGKVQGARKVAVGSQLRIDFSQTKLSPDLAHLSEPESPTSRVKK